MDERTADLTKDRLIGVGLEFGGSILGSRRCRRKIWEEEALKE